MRGTWRFPSTHPRYRRVTLAPAGGARIEDAAPGTTEFPRIDPRHVGRRHRVAFALNGLARHVLNRHGDASHWAFHSVARLDPDGADPVRWRYAPCEIPEEHVFVPRGEAEGEGWLLGRFLDATRRTSGLRVFDAGHVADGPVWERARCPIPCRTRCTGRLRQPAP